MYVYVGLIWFPIRDSCLSLSLIGDHILVAFFLICVVGSCLCIVALVHISSCTFRLVVLFSEFRFIKIMWNSTHAAPWSDPYDERDSCLLLKDIANATA